MTPVSGRLLSIMPRFHYQATDKEHVQAEGVIEAENRYVAVARLLQDGLHVVEIGEVTGDPHRETPSQPPATDSVRLGEDEQIAVADGMAEIIRGGLPLSAGLRALATELPSKRTRRAIETISDRLEQGIAVDDAVAGQIEKVPRHMRVLLQASLQTGRITDLLEHYLHFARTSLDTRRRSILALFYPLLLVTVTLVGTAGILTFVVPTFQGLFNEFGIAMPPVTIAVLAISDWVSGGRLLILPVVLVLLVVAWVAFGWLAGPTQRKCLYHVPVVGRMVRLGAVSRFCHLLAIGIDHGVSFPESLRLAGSGTADAYILKAARSMAVDIEQGLPPKHAATTHRMVPEVAHVFEWEGPDKGFSDVLWATGDICAIQSRGQSRLIGVVIQPLAFVTVTLVVAIVVSAMIMPLIKLMGAIAAS